MTRLDEIAGQKRPIELLRRFLDRGRIPHALLFHGPDGVGKATVARAFATALLCTETGEVACGACASCRMIENRAHTDLWIVERLPKKDPTASRAAEPAAAGDLRRFIVVDQIRQLCRMAAFAPREGRYRAFIVDEADRMNVEAQNALLKTLEEPPGQSVLMLIASRPRLLLPTVRSRCFSLHFAALQPSELTRWLQQRGIPTAEAALRAGLAAGRPGLALEIDPAAVQEQRDQLLAILENLIRGRRGVDELPAMAAYVAGKSEPVLVESLHVLQGLLRDAARTRLKGGEAGLFHADLAPRLRKLGDDLGAERAAALVRTIDRLRNDLRFNLNRTLLAETVLAAVAGGPLP